jgi:hypothetical protein
METWERKETAAIIYKAHYCFRSKTRETLGREKWKIDVEAKEREETKEDIKSSTVETRSGDLGSGNMRKVEKEIVIVFDRGMKGGTFGSIRHASRDYSSGL